MRAAPKRTPSPAERLPAAAALVVAVGTLAGLLLGFLRDIVIAGRFGASSQIDAFLVAQAVMNLVLGLIAGALAKAVVPVVARSVEHGRPGDGAASLRVALTVATVVLTAGGLLMWLAAPAVISVLAPGFDRSTANLAVELTRILLVATVFVAGTNILAGAAQAHRIFLWSALQGVPFNLAVIAAAVFLSAFLGVHALAVGFVVGSVLRLLLQFVPLRRLGVRLVPSFRLRDPGFREIAGLVPGLLVTSALSNVNTLVDRAVGSTVGEGSISALNYAARLLSVPQALLVVALVTTLYPAFSAATAPERRGELAELVRRGSAVLLALLVPVVVVLVLAGDAVVVLVFGYGEFDDRAVGLTAAALAASAAGILALGMHDLLTRVGYALGDTRAPILAAVAGMGVNVVGDLTLGRALGVSGIALSTAAAFVVAAVLLAAALHHRHRAVDPVALTLVAGRLLAVGAVSAAAAYGVMALLRLDPATDGAGPAGLLLGATVAATAAAYLVGLRCLAPREFAGLVEFGRDAVRRRRRSR